MIKINQTLQITDIRLNVFSIAGKTKKVPILGEMLAGCEAMVFVLGVATTIVGFFLGTFFGINIVKAGWIPATTALGGILAWLQGNVPGTEYSIQMAGAICIGVFHICLAMIIKALLYTQKEGFKSQISTWGWVILLVGGVITGVLTLAVADEDGNEINPNIPFVFSIFIPFS